MREFIREHPEEAKVPRRRSLWPVIGLMVAVPVAFGSMMPAGPSRIDQAVVHQVAAERQVRALLRDPASAEFRHSAPGRCGSVNASNGLGGMAGYQRFLITPTGPVLEEQADPVRFNRVWTSTCAR